MKQKMDDLMHSKIMIGGLTVVIILLGILITRPVEFSPIIDVRPSENMLRDTLSVSGNSEITKTPDQAIAYINVITENLDAQTAQQENTQKSNQVIAAIKTWGVSEDDIETNSYSLNKKQQWNPDTRQYEDKGYTVTHSLKITTTRINDLGSLVDTAVQAGANGISSVIFTLKKESEEAARNQALKLATEKATSKAQQIANAAGITANKIINIQEQNYVYSPYRMSYDSSITPMSEGAGESTKISPNEVEITATVNVIYSIN